METKITVRAVTLSEQIKNDYAVFASVRMHLAHNVFCTLRPFSMTVTFCKLGRKGRLVARLENETL